VGHTDYHLIGEQQHGGELDNLQTKALGFLDARNIYRYFNGPVNDKGGFIDGTVTFYMLCRLRSNDRYAVLWLDEQSGPSDRWRLVHPDDGHFSAAGSIANPVSKLVNDQPSPAEWNYSKSEHWCPFEAGKINMDSRMAVSRQIILVTGHDEVPELYSINWSWGTADRTWRWRRYPARLFVGKKYSPLDGNYRGSIDPQTVRLREDMTICIEGTIITTGNRIIRGFWMQRYLPCTNQHVPHANRLNSQKPGSGYTHDWRFMPEDVFEFVNPRYSHIWAYEKKIDSRCQYYSVTINDGLETISDLTDAEQKQLQWEDRGNVFFINGIYFPFIDMADFPPIRTPLDILNMATNEHAYHPPSLFEPHLAFRIFRKPSGNGYAAILADKRDDDIVEFTDYRDKRAKLSSSAGSIEVTFTSHERIDYLPCIRYCKISNELAMSEDRQSISYRYIIYLECNNNVDSVRKHISSICLGAVFPGPELPAGWINPGVNVYWQGPIEDINAVRNLGNGWFGYSVSFLSDRQDIFSNLTEEGAMLRGASVWVKDMLGHVAYPDKIEFAVRSLSPYE
jgi:hypothetical protein